ncbi:MAG TPA: outer membrane protein assembly factor, partial [Candidatus Krumholzibacteria bacterium]
ASVFFRKETLGFSGVVLERSGFLANTDLYRGRHSTVEIEGSIERVRKLPLQEEVELFGDPSATTRSISSVLTRDARNNPFDPIRGSHRFLLVETAGGVIGGANDFNKGLGSFVHLQALPGDATFAFRVQAGWAEAFGDSRESGVPLEARFFAGGSNSVRGYRENSLGPRLTAADSLSVVDDRFLANRPTAGGNALLQLNAELRFPIPLISRWGFRGAVFADGGNVWENWSRVSLQRLRLTSTEQGEDATTILDLRTSVGFSLHYRTPVGPLRLDYGLPLKRAELRDPLSGAVEVDPPHIWHFSLGHAF